MKITLEQHIRNKIDNLEKMQDYEVATDTIRCWIDEYNECVNNKIELVNKIKLVRYFKKGHWIKTKHRGWITLETYKGYLRYGLNPTFLDEEVY